MNISKAISSIGHGISLSLRKNSPKILLWTGIASMGAGTILACRATLKSKEIIDETRDKNEDLEYLRDMGEITEDECDKKIVKNNITTAGRVALQFAVPAALWTAGGISVSKGFTVVEDRLNTTTAALVANTKNYDAIIKRLDEKLGTEETQKLLYDIHDVRESETVVDPNTGKEKTRNVTKTVSGEDLTGGVEIRLERHNWPEKSNVWESDISQLTLAQSEANEALKDRALFSGKSIYMLVEFLQRINYRPAFESEFILTHHNAGWVWTNENPMKIDLGLDEANNLKNWSVVDESIIVLHLNCVPNVFAYV